MFVPWGKSLLTSMTSGCPQEPNRNDVTSFIRIKISGGLSFWRCRDGSRLEQKCVGYVGFFRPDSQEYKMTIGGLIALIHPNPIRSYWYGFCDQSPCSGPPFAIPTHHYPYHRACYLTSAPPIFYKITRWPVLSSKRRVRASVRMILYSYSFRS